MASILQQTFLHIPGIGRATERALWDSGICTWADVDGSFAPGIRSGTIARLREFVPKSREAVVRKDASFFSRLSRMGEAWRLYEAFADECVYLDVETTGLSPVFDSLTIVGLYDGREYRLFVEGQNLAELPQALKEYSMVVTFNGALFDLQFLKASFPNIDLPPIHVDLRWLTRRLGLRGGLKVIEPEFGLRRPSQVKNLSGFDATVLWSRYLRGDRAALDLLIEYNSQDVVNLKSIMEQSHLRLARATAGLTASRKATRSRLLRSPSASNIDVLGLDRRETSQPEIVSALLEKAAAAGHGVRIVGIDLTGSERRASGWALLDGRQASTARITTDSGLVAKTLEARPDIVSIDSPLSFPGGTKSLSECREAGLPIYRACELALKRMGISVFWCLLPSMQSLTMRGIQLAAELRKHGLQVIESYPGAAQDVLGIPRKRSSLEELKWGLHRAGINGPFLRDRVSHDEVDAITSALVGLCYAADDCIALGNPTENYLIVPRSRRINYSRLSEIALRTGLNEITLPQPGPLLDELHVEPAHVHALA